MCLWDNIHPVCAAHHVVYKDIYDSSCQHSSGVSSCSGISPVACPLEGILNHLVLDTGGRVYLRSSSAHLGDKQEGLFLLRKRLGSYLEWLLFYLWHYPTRTRWSAPTRPQRDNRHSALTTAIKNQPYFGQEFWPLHKLLMDPIFKKTKQIWASDIIPQRIDLQPRSK